MVSLFGIEVPLAALAGFISAFLAALSVGLVWLQWRERKFRQDDVLRWSNEVIRTLQTLHLACTLREKAFGTRALDEVFLEVLRDASVLVEQGRLLFRNTPDAEHGKDRHPAYRGYRPKLLDPIVVAHQIASHWDVSDAAGRRRMALVAEDCVKTFVSLAQLEVGRSRTVSAHAGGRGEGLRIGELMAAISEPRLARQSDLPRESL